MCTALKGDILPYYYSHLLLILDEAMASVYLDNKLVKQTDWKPVSQQCWDLRFTLDLDRVRNR